MLKAAAALGACAIAGLLLAPGAGAQTVRGAEMPELQAIGATAAWPVSKGQGVTVGVLDTGADPGVPDLTGTVIVGPDYTAGADPAGYQPPHLHGTYISSLIAGHGSGPGRSQGIIGVAPAAKVLSVRVILDDSEPGLFEYNENPAYSNAIGNGIRYAVSHGVSVINMSLGTPQPTRDLREAVAYAISRGVVVVAAAGNSGSADGGFTPYDYPASFTGVIAVAAVGSSGQRASFSDRNASVEISAPGVSVLGAGPGGSYLSGDGTSPASAFVAGVAALIKSRYPGLPPALVEQAIITTARNKPAAAYSTDTGFGEIDAPDALAAAARLAATRPSAGLAASARFGAGTPGPIRVVHRDAARIITYGTVSALAAVGFLAAVTVFAVAVVRGRRRLRIEAELPRSQELA